MSERHYPSYYKLEVRPEPGDRFCIIVDNDIVAKNVPRKQVPEKLKEYLDEQDD